MNLKEIKEIIALMNENGLAEIEIEREGLKLKLRKNPPVPQEGSYRPVIEYKMESHPGLSAAPPSSSSAVKPGKSTHEIISPMVGTFYRAPSPEAPAFVEAGQIVEVGQVVCIVEAMKLMNEIKSEIRGRIIEMAVENAQPVEFGQTLFVLEPA